MIRAAIQPIKDCNRYNNPGLFPLMKGSGIVFFTKNRLEEKITKKMKIDKT